MPGPRYVTPAEALAIGVLLIVVFVLGFFVGLYVDVH
jgi:hypothetical protein